MVDALGVLVLPRLAQESRALSVGTRRRRILLFRCGDRQRTASVGPAIGRVKANTEPTPPTGTSWSCSSVRSSGRPSGPSREAE